MENQFNLLYPEWQGYSSHKEVYHGAKHFCNHVRIPVDHEVNVNLSEELIKEDDVIGKSSILNMLNGALRQLNQQDPNQLFMVGGTCGCELAPISFLNKKYDGDLAVFWFDAHGDLNTPATSPSKRFHGMPLRSLLGEGDKEIVSKLPKTLSKSQVALVGARDLDPGELDFIDEHNIPVFKPESDSHTSELIDFAKKEGFTKAYIHFDLDVLDPEEFPHVLVSVNNGLQVQKAINALKLISQNMELVGSSIVEFCPKEGGGVKDVLRLVEEGMNIHF